MRFFLAIALVQHEALRPTTRRAWIQRAAALPPALVGGVGGARADVPRVGRFEKLSGATQFIGEWVFEATAEGAKTAGALVFEGNGDCKLVDGGGRLLGESATPWKYANKNDQISVSFTLDLSDFSDNVLILDGSIEEDGVLRGVVLSGDAEVGARGAGKRRKVGLFSATRLREQAPAGRLL